MAGVVVGDDGVGKSLAPYKNTLDQGFFVITGLLGWLPLRPRLPGSWRWAMPRQKMQAARTASKCAPAVQIRFEQIHVRPYFERGTLQAITIKMTAHATAQIGGRLSGVACDRSPPYRPRLW